MLRVVLLSCAIVYASAQTPSYRCTPADFCTGQSYERADEFGCTYWCYLDRLEEGTIDCPNFHVRFLEWKGPAAECNHRCYVDANKAVLPGACNIELDRAFLRLAELDGRPDAISGDDVEIWCQQVKFFTPPGERISPDNWRDYWQILYEDIHEPNCTP